MLRLFVCLLFCSSYALGQVLPEGVASAPFVCPPREGNETTTESAEPQTAEELEAQARRARYRAVLPAYLAVVPETPDSKVIMPVDGVRVRDVADTWGGARSEGRSHEGTDIFAPAGTPIYAATPGYIYRIGDNRLGGQTVVVVGGAGYRYYYAHLSGYAEDIQEGQAVTTDTLLGYVGNTGNAITTPPHLHLGIYTSEAGSCDWDAINPYPLLVDRE